MYKDIPNIEPLNDDVTIWRYMDLASFMNLILEKKLMLRRASSFKDYYDTFVDLDDESIKSLNKAFFEGEKRSNLSSQDAYKISSFDEESDYPMFTNPIQPIF